MAFPEPDVPRREEWEEFVAANAANREERQPLGSGRDAWEAVKMVDAIYESERTGAVARLVPAT